jgi:hypothetical protein
MELISSLRIIVARCASTLPCPYLISCIARISWPDYTEGMETVVTIPDDVFRKAEDLAAALGLSRSEIYAAALAEFIRERRDLYITERLNEVYVKDDSDLDPVIQQMQTASLPVEQW